MENSTTYFKRGLQGYLHQYLNDAVDAGYETVSEIKKYAETKPDLHPYKHQKNKC